jgi:hypothetical protein
LKNLVSMTIGRNRPEAAIQEYKVADNYRHIAAVGLLYEARHLRRRQGVAR